MNKTTLLGIAVVILLIVNIITLGFIGFQAGGHAVRGGHAEPKDIIMHRLHFNADQRSKYEELILWHRENINKYDNKIRSVKEALYALLSKNNAYSKKDSLISVINGYQKQIEETHFKHFKDIKKLCRQDQQKYYNELIEELPALFSLGHLHHERPE